MVYFSVLDWKNNPSICTAKVRERLQNGPYIVRSSCVKEDCIHQSNAGAFLSRLCVWSEGLETAIEEVIASYRPVTNDDEILIQPFLQNVIRSGVAFSHDPNTCSPYRVVNWTEGSDTTSVTSGTGGRMWQYAAAAPLLPHTNVLAVFTLLEELLDLFGGSPLDCEFAINVIDGHEVLWLLQVRPLILSRPPVSSTSLQQRLSVIYEKVRVGMESHPFLLGKRSVYGVMPDWNPAEIIGVRPRPLSLSLYRELVTDSIWAYQRNNYGYRNLRSFPLMLNFYGLPYIDVRVSFNSFIPAELDEELAGRLVDHYINCLLGATTLHDKVEFEIVLSCYTFDLPNRLQRLPESEFSDDDRASITGSLRRLTNSIMHPVDGLWRLDASKIAVLKKRRAHLIAAGGNDIERIYWLLEDTKRYGTLPFAGLARAGFIAVQMLKSLTVVGVFTDEDYYAFVGSLFTMTRQLASDRSRLRKDVFLSHYGHLRPGTYEILSLRYDEAPDVYFDWSSPAPLPDPPPHFSLTLPQMREIAGLLKVHGLGLDPVEMFNFIQSAIELRESSKFEFSRNLSDILALILNVGQKHGFTRDDLSYCDISVFKELYASAVDTRELIQRSIEHGKLRHEETLAISLPPLITCPEDVWSFEWPETAPNFVTQREVTAPVVTYNSGSSLAEAIVCIPSADPGFDWLFSQNIAGLITAWGGANSHMAIRAGEMGLPAVIGAGEMYYRRWSSAHKLHLDCAGKRVLILS